MASTNKTTNYNLSQYIGTDKPTYLTDYNQDMSKIDTGIHAAKLEADNNATSIGTLSNLTTTAKTDLVSAVNEIDGEVATNTSNIATNTSNIATNTTHIGTLTNLTTSSKTDLVVAANEINAKAGNLSNLTTSAKSSLVNAINEVVSKFNFVNFKDLTGTSSGNTNVTTVSRELVEFAANSDYSIIKIYGRVNLQCGSAYGSEIKYPNVIPAQYRPSEDIIVNGACMITSFGNSPASCRVYMVIGADGSIAFNTENGGSGALLQLQMVNSLIFVKDFGDIPE